MRRLGLQTVAQVYQIFPFLFGGTFIEAAGENVASTVNVEISLPFRRDFH